MDLLLSQRARLPLAVLRGLKGCIFLWFICVCVFANTQTHCWCAHGKINAVATLSLLSVQPEAQCEKFMEFNPWEYF